MLIYLLRHGQTEYNAQKRYQGQRDIPLSAAGIAQLRQADFAPEVVYVTPLQRTAQTARVFFPGAKLIPVDGLKEMNFGRFEGQPFVQVEQDPEYLAWVQENEHAAHPDGERRSDFCNRVCKTLADLIDKALAEGQERLVIVAHGGTQMAARPAQARLLCVVRPQRGRLCAGCPGLAGAAHPAPGGDRAVHQGERMMEQGLLHLYWGDGKGKTTAAMGLALRALGSGKRVVIVQFLKGGQSGEIPLLAQLGAKIFRGKGGQKFVFQMNEAEKAAARAVQNENLTAALAEPADLLILDEAGSAWELDMVDKDLLRRAVLERPAAQECVLTAHKAPQWMLDAADYSTEMKCRRHPYQKGIKARKGIEY